jgi:adenosylhomocysteine nucleosidase
MYLVPILQRWNEGEIGKHMIGLIAVRGEANVLLKSVDIETKTKQSQAQLYQGHLAGRSVILAEVGPGKVQTAAITQHLIDRYNVNLMVSCGSAGALAQELQVGDVVLAARITPHDFGLYLSNGFQHLGIYDNAHPGGLHYHRALTADPGLLALAGQAALAVTWPQTPPRIETGCLVSGDQVIADGAKKQWLRDTFNALAVEMESGAMAQVAFLNDIPWLAVRAVSDSADSAIDFGQLNLITYSDEPGNTLARFQRTVSKVATLAKKPAHLKAALKIRRGLQRASANAAMVTAAIIAQIE